MSHYISGWWFGCHFWHFPINIGNVIIPIDVHILQRGGPTTNQYIVVWEYPHSRCSHYLSGDDESVRGKRIFFVVSASVRRDWQY